jgi:signal transduction histidine kinase
MKELARMLGEELVDITSETNALKHQLFEAQKLSSVGAIASSVAHEFNNVLTTIINYTKMAQRTDNDENRKQALEKILKGGQKAAVIVSSMLGYARKGNLKKEPTDLATLIDEVLVLTEKDLHKHQIKLTKTYIDKPKVPVIASQIEQVLLNLIINSRQAMEQGGELKISLKTNQEMNLAEISVADSGKGIAPQNLRKIFDPFFTTKNPDQSGQGGTGLGLSVCRQIIDDHCGRMRVESAVGKGTTFIIKLPLNPESIAA